MPIYAYRCEACGFTRDVLQKLSDAPLTQCSSCGKPAFKKQLTAAGFQLKGTGWYATDFRGGVGSSEPAVEKHESSAPAAANNASAASPAATNTAASSSVAAPAAGAASTT